MIDFSRVFCFGWAHSRPSARLPLFSFLLLLWSMLLLSGCGKADPTATATPTKTPLPAGEPVIATPVPVAQATDTPVPPTATALVAAPPTPTPLPANVAPYTGKTVADAALLQERPILICVNNDAVGRSAHYGLSRADLVYEYIVDGFTVTRITALYQSQTADRVGPVRSARMPNIWMTQMYDGVLACSGGSDEVRYLLKNEVGFPYLDADIDDPSNNVYFSSIGSDYRTRLQISTDGVRRWLRATGGGNSGVAPVFSTTTRRPPSMQDRPVQSRSPIPAATASNGAMTPRTTSTCGFRVVKPISTTPPARRSAPTM